MFLLKDLTKSTMWVIIATLTTYAVGFLSNLVMAKYLGASWHSDVYFSLLLYPLFIYGIGNAILMSGFIYKFNSRLSEESSSGNNSISSMAFFSFIAFALINIFVIIFARFFINNLFYGFSEQIKETSISVLRLFGLASFFLGFSSLTNSLLLIKKKFFVAGVYKALVSLGLILGVILFYYLGIYGVAAGYLVGNILGIIVHVFFLKRAGISLFSSQYDLKFIKSVLIYSMPLVVSSIIFVVNKYITNSFAISLGEGSISSLNYAFTILSAPVILFSASLGTASTPLLAESKFNSENKSLNKEVRDILFKNFLLMSLITILFILFNEQLINFLFLRGNFTYGDSIRTASTLLYYSFGLVPYSAYILISSISNSIGKLRLSLFINILILVINSAASFLFIKLGVAGLAIAFSVSQWAVFLIILFLAPFSSKKESLEKSRSLNATKN